MQSEYPHDESKARHKASFRSELAPPVALPAVQLLLELAKDE